MTSAAASAEPSLRSRVIARKYRLDTLLGEGGMGSVWRAVNLQLEAPVAIKLLRADLDNGELGERLRVEARAAAKLVHPHIVRIFDVDESEHGEPFIVMELLDGETLRSIIDRGPMNAVHALQLLLPTAEALSLAHSRGVVHRDYKPDNIFLARIGDALQPKLLDFGIAKVTSTAAVAGATITCSGMVLGSPEYMSPEQALGRSDIDHRSDIWSFCVVLYEALCGHTPFSGNTTQEVLRAVVQDEPLPLELVTDVDPALSALIASGLAKDPDARPQSMFELGQALAAWLSRHGALEDATGAALDFKWLGRGTEGSDLTSAVGSFAPHVQHGQVTLVSVVHPGPPPGSFPTPQVVTPQRRRVGFTAVASVAALALLGGVGFAAMKGDRSVSVAGAAQVTELSPATPAAASDPPAAAIAPHPVDVRQLPAQTIAPAPAAVAPPRVAVRKSTARESTTRAVSLREPAGALPRALPASVARQRSDLLNPY